jgi:alcohol dehydrogenase class IV
VLFHDADVGEHALDVEVVDREVSRAADRDARVAARRRVGDAIDLEAADVIREALHHAVAADDHPTGRERRHLAHQMLGQGGADGLHLRT